MNRFRLIFITFVALLLAACGGSGLLTKDEILEKTGLYMLPIQDEYPDDGGVILYEKEAHQLFLDTNWDVNREMRYEWAMIYFNDKAEDALTHTIYLDPEVRLISFAAQTQKPNGETIELTEEDLHPANVNPSYVEFSDNQSLKFTFPGVEKGAVISFSFHVIDEGWYGGDVWYIQEYLPKLYSRYEVTVPDVFLKAGNNWTYNVQNVYMGRPNDFRHIANKGKYKVGPTYYWEARDIPALKREPDMPPFLDVSQHIRLGIKYDNWNEWSGYYWDMIAEYFNTAGNAEVKKLAEEITAGAESDREKIERIYAWTQKNCRYIATDIDDSGYVPHSIDKIIHNKYGDCKDMTVLNAGLLKAVGIEAYPALVRTKNRGKMDQQTISLGLFNHMINYVKTSGGEEYWLDATGSSCPLGEVYSGIEGIDALVIYSDGKCEFKTIPKSTYRDNMVRRVVDIMVHNDGHITGDAVLTFLGNENLGFRSRFKDASESDMQKTFESYVNANTSDLKINDIVYDDPAAIADTFRISFNFERDRAGSNAGDLMIFKPGIFKLSAELDRYRDEERKHNLFFRSPYTIRDEVRIHYNADNFDVQSDNTYHAASKRFAYFKCQTKPKEEGVIEHVRVYQLRETDIKKDVYQDFRGVQQAIARANDENIVLKRK